MRDQDMIFRAAINGFDSNALNYFIQGVKIDSTPDTLTSARINDLNYRVRMAMCKLTQIKEYLDKLEGTYGPYTYPMDQRVASGMETPCPIDNTHINHTAQPLSTDLV